MQSLRVMIVDDQTGIRRLLAEYFTSAGWESLEAGNGREALKLMPASPDIVLLDMKMPVMDGLETLRALRSSHPGMPVIVMTAYGELDMLRQAETMGISNKISKPFDMDVLRRMIESAYSTYKVS